MSSVVACGVSRILATVSGLSPPGTNWLVVRSTRPMLELILYPMALATELSKMLRLMPLYADAGSLLKKNTVQDGLAVNIKSVCTNPRLGSPSIAVKKCTEMPVFLMYCLGSTRCDTHQACSLAASCSLLMSASCTSRSRSPDVALRPVLPSHLAGRPSAALSCVKSTPVICSSHFTVGMTSAWLIRCVKIVPSAPLNTFPPSVSISSPHCSCKFILILGAYCIKQLAHQVISLVRCVAGLNLFH